MTDGRLAIGRPSSPRPRGRRGSTLVEVLLAIMLMSIVVLGIAAGFQTTAKVSGDASARSALQGVLDSVTDRVATIAYPGCSSASQITAALSAAHVAPAGYEASVVAVTYLVPAAACSPSTSAVMLTVQVADVRQPTVRLSGDVVVRDPAARPS